MEFKYVKIETFIPEEFVHELRVSLNLAGALSIGGNYDNCMAVSKVTGYWRPLKDAVPFKGTYGEISKEEECKVEFCCRSEVLKAAVMAIRKVHPYEEPVINVLPLLDPFEI